MIPAIPRTVLNMTATYNAAGVEDAYGNPGYGASVTLSNVYIRPTRNVLASTLGEDKSYDLVLYFDARNSLPVGQTFAVKDRITWGGVNYNVRTVEPYYDATNGALHHYEVKLAGC